MGFLLDMTSTVQCSHMGKATATIPNPRVKIMGQPTVLQSTPYLVAGCTFPPPPAGNGPCVNASFTTGTMRVMSMGQPLLMMESIGLCTPTGTPTVIMMAQTRVRGL